MDTTNDPYQAGCPSRLVIEMLADKWTLLVLGVLRLNGGPLRFNELRRRLGGITQKMLTQTLRGLERDGLVRRTVYAEVPARVDYELTEIGLRAGELTKVIADWASTHADAITDARANFDG
ncbi:winged helix-turn-helix transcriptional regulator [Amycolatopsis magusensis]|uniref:DNA-binding HxlR family transcriptional regulator n=1 Tax=Amycolatopsis magusensis TaxID=882444 RepID=A0ABS4PQQ1_9PSEU|nr:helix-turn-helix domain-containing protein [Amycolatopsis magusensis]MBP2181747.1 DNA-binding HxlR family transcriptional regulator [Amycolatopsis magusensis]